MKTYLREPGDEIFLPHVAFSQKAGICKRGVPAFTVQQSSGGMKVLREVAEQIAVKMLKVVPPLESLFPPEQSPILGIKGEST